MVTQKAISVRIDIETLTELDIERRNGNNRNRLINRAVRMYLDALDTKRRMACYTDKDEELLEFCRRWLV